MKKRLCMLLLGGLCLGLMSACGNTAVSDNTTASDNADNIPAEEAAVEEDDSSSAEEKIRIEDIAWNVDEGIIGGDRYVILDYTNNTPYTVADFEITFKERSDITEEEKQAFYSDVQEIFGASDAEIEELKGYDISMNAGTQRVIDPGESVTNANCCYYTGSYRLKDINHYKLVEPDIVTIKYIDGADICTTYYDYSSGKYSAESGTETAYQWSQTDIGDKMPKPDVKVLKSSVDIEELFMFEAYGMSWEQFEAYVEECKDMGYTVEASGFEEFYSAGDAEGYNIDLYYKEDDFMMSGAIQAPDEEVQSDIQTSDEEVQKDISASEKEGNDGAVSETAEKEESDTEEELVDGLRPEFKEAMDSYEAFYDEYCAFMKKYMKNPTDLNLLTEYANMVQKDAEMAEKFKAWDNEEMNDAELKYYLDVNNRVMQKLLEVSG